MMTAETIEKIKAVEKLIQEGSPVKEAIQKVGISISAYYTRKRQLDAAKGRDARAYSTRKKKIIVSDLSDLAPIKSSSKLFVVTGDVNEVVEFMRRYA